ncbi:MAG: ELWxxDGT repeat protein [Planctomycetota bacterium]
MPPVVALVVALAVALGVLLPSCSGSSSGQPVPELTALVKDIRLEAAVNDSLPRQLVRVGVIVYFVATTQPHGTEIWKTDGTETGTVLVKDILPGSISSFPEDLTAVGNTLYFSAFGPSAGRELWKTDGTAAGTVLVKDIKPGCDSSSPRNLAADSNTLYFTAADDEHGNELWKSDGTAVGTVLVKDIEPGRMTSGAPWSSFPAELTLVGSTLFFTARTQLSGYELWKSDGTASGTVLVADIRAGVGSSHPNNLHAFDNKVFFAADDSSSGSELWSSNGSASGTVLVRDIRPGSFGSHPRQLTVLGRELLFTAIGTSGSELWKTDGTRSGTVIVRDIFAGGGGSVPGGLTVIGDRLYFAATSGGIGRELWKSDGTSAGTTLVKDINTSAAAAGSFPASLTAISDAELLFAADDGKNGFELWKSDGTAAGTTLLADIRPGADADGTPLSSSPLGLVWSGTAVLFAARDGRLGSELFLADGSAAGTVLVKNLDPEGGASSRPTQLTEFLGAIYFVADEGNAASGSELWRSDGTAAGTTLLLDIRPGPKSSLPVGFTVVGGTMFFTAYTDANGRELWKTNGTLAGTSIVHDIQPGADARGNPLSSAPAGLTAVGGTLFFTATDNTSGTELWRSNGTPGGTVLVKDIWSGTLASAPSELTAIGGTVFFAAVDSNNGTELWRSNGTDAGTVLVKDIRPGAAGSAPSNLTVVGNTLFFVASDGNTGRELWKSNGTDRGTVLVKDIHAATVGPTATSSFPMKLTAVGNTLFFSAEDGIRGRELWQSDGSAAGTALVRDIRPGTFHSVPNSSTPSNLHAVGGALIFWANDGRGGSELWRSDGTVAGTAKLREIFPGCLGSAPPVIQVLGGEAWFYAPTPATGFELWRSDGTAAGTEMAHEFNPGMANGIDYDTSFALRGQSLFTGATDGVRGTELWRVSTSR